MDSGRHAGERERGERPKYAAGLDYELGRPWESGGVAIKGADSQDRVSHTALHRALSCTCRTSAIPIKNILKQQQQPPINAGL